MFSFGVINCFKREGASFYLQMVSTVSHLATKLFLSQLVDAIQVVSGLQIQAYIGIFFKVMAHEVLTCTLSVTQHLLHFYLGDTGRGNIREDEHNIQLTTYKLNLKMLFKSC